MKDKGYGVVHNWNYITISLIIFVILTVLVLYMPGIREFDKGVLTEIRRFLGQFPSYIPVFFSEFGRANYMLWPQITVCSVLVSHQKYLKAFLVVFFTHGAYWLNNVIQNFVCRETPYHSSGFGFPSCHASTTMCLYGIAVYLILHYTRSEFWRYFLAIMLGGFIFMTALSRLWLGANFLTDVIAGLCLGFIFVNLYIITVKAFNS